MKRNHEVRIKLSEEEFKKIKEKADKVNMKISSLLRYLGLKTNLKVTLED
jgi:hypothetical protein